MRDRGIGSRRVPSGQQVQSAGVPLQRHRREWRAGLKATPTRSANRRAASPRPRPEEHGVSSIVASPRESAYLTNVFQVRPGNNFLLPARARWRPPSSRPGRQIRTTPPSPIAGLRFLGPAPAEPGCGPDHHQGRKSGPDSIRATPQFAMVAPGSSSMIGEVSPPLVAAQHGSDRRS